MLKNIALLIAGLGILPVAGCMSGPADGENVQADEAAVVSCTSPAGIFPTKAGLMVAMGIELGRWEAIADLSSTTSDVSLASSAKCVKNSCKNTKAILGQQSQGISALMSGSVFDPTQYRSDLFASFQRQADIINDLKLNHPTQLPVAHKLKLVGGPVNLGTGACGAHYIFQADHTDGTALTTTEATNIVNDLGFYGYWPPTNQQFVSNPYIAFAVTSQGCPSGRTCIAVDPTATDNSTTSQTSQAAVMYPLNRLYDTAGVMLGKACITTGNLAGTMVSKCSTMPTTCGFLYCVAN